MFELQIERRGDRFVVTRRRTLERTERGEEYSVEPVEVPSPAEEGEPSAIDRVALEWISSRPPVVIASLASRPTASSVYVPTSRIHLRNPGSPTRESVERLRTSLERRDVMSARQAQLSTALVAALERAQRLLVELRPHRRQLYSVDAPDPPRLRLMWRRAPPAALQAALASLIQRALSFPPRPAERRPRPRARSRGRSIGPRREPPMPTEAPEASRLGRDWIVFAGAGSSALSAVRCVEISQRFRATLAHYAGQPPPTVLRNGDDGPTVAVVPLPLVSRPQATVPLVGVAVIWPRDLDLVARRDVLRGIIRWELTARTDDDPGLANEGPRLILPLTPRPWPLRRILDVPPNPSLRPSTWCAPSRVWATATPVALGTATPTEPLDADALHAAFVAECRRLGLPGSTAVEVKRASVLPGSIHTRFFPPYPGPTATADAPTSGQRPLFHARLEFPYPVRGPLILGVGRDHGLGLCRPLSRNDESPDPRKDGPMFDPWPF